MAKRVSTLFVAAFALLCLVQLAWSEPTGSPVGTEAQLLELPATGISRVYLTNDIRLTQSVVVGSGKTLTVDLNGKTLDRGLESATSGSENGSVFHVKVGGRLLVEDDSGNKGTVTGGYSVKGGGIWNEGETNVTGGVITANRADDCGGIYNAEGAFLNVEGATVSGNWSHAGGGGIVNYGTADIRNTLVENNEATTRGGGIWNNSKLTVASTVLRGNSIGSTSSAVNGGGICLRKGSDAELSDVTFENNTSPDGAAVYMDGGASAVFKGTNVIRNNTTTRYGGGGITNYGSLSIQGSFEATNNTAVTNGGGIWTMGSLQIQGAVTIKNNRGGDNLNNLYLVQDHEFELTGTLGETSEIWLTTQDPSAVVTRNWTEQMGEALPENFLKSDVGDVAVLDNGVVVFVTPSEPELLGTFQKVTSESELFDGGHYILVATLQNGSAAAGELALGSGEYSSGTSYLVAVPITVAEDRATVTENSGVIGFTLQRINDGYALIREGKYLYSPLNKNLDFATEEKTCDVIQESGGFVVKCDDRKIQYNASSPRFTAYESNQTAAHLFFKTDDGAVVFPPVISGTTPFKPSTEVTISAGEGETVYYTTDGTDPTTSSAVYTAPFTLTQTTTVKAIARKGEHLSAPAVRQFTILPAFTVEPDLVPGAYYNSRTVTFTMQNGESPYTVSYSVSDEDGSVEGSADGEFSVEVTKTSTIAISATDGNGEQFVASFAYTIEPYEVAEGFKLLTDLAELQTGVQVLFAADYYGDFYVMGKEGSNNRKAIQYDESDGVVPETLAYDDDYGVAVVQGNDDGTFSFLDVANGGYLQSTATSGTNHLKTGAMSEYAHADITLDEYNSVVVTFGDADRNTLRLNFNQGTPLFSCYIHGFNQIPVYIYVKEDEASTYGAVTIAADRSSATIDGNYDGADETIIPEDIAVGSVTLDRTFNVGTFSTIVLPFSISLDRVSGAEFYGFSEMVRDGSGKWTAGATKVTGTLAANTPYLVRPSATSITFDGAVTLKATEPQTPKHDNWEFQGAYRYIVFGDIKAENPGNTYYGFAAQNRDGYTVGQFAKAGDKAYIYPMRAYLVYNDGSGSAKNVGGYGIMDALPETIDLKIMDENGVVTETATVNTRTGEIRRDRWFDLQGRLLKGKPTVKGQYLHKGKVEIIK